MLGFLATLLNGLYSFLAQVLPTSPFADMAWLGNVPQYLGWLNWIMPFGDMISLLGIWVAAFLAAKIGMTLANGITNTIQIWTGE